MPKEETIELRHIRSVIGEKDDLPSINARSTLSSIVRAIITKFYSVPQLIHLYGALGLNKTLTFAAGEDFIQPLFSDGTYLYAGLETSPGKVIKIDLATFTKVSTLTFAAGEDLTQSLFSDGTYLYAGVGTSPGKVIKIDLSTFTAVSTLTFASDENIAYGLFSDGTYLYVGLDTSPGKVIKIDLATFTKVSTLTFAVNENSTRSLFSDGTYLYVGLNTSPGKVVKIDLATFTKVSTLTFASDESSTRALFSDGTYLYAGVGTSPGKVVKIDLATFTKVSTLTFAVNENSTRSLFSDGTYLYVGLNTSPGKVVKIDLATFTKVSTLTFASDESSTRALFSDGTYLYAGLETSPGKVVRKYIIPLNDQHQRKIDITKEVVQCDVSSSTSAGLVTTLVDTARTEGDDYWNGLTLMILGGACKGQSRQITDFDAASDTITVAPAFTAAIASGVRYAILPCGSGSSTLVQADILNDATPFAGADIAIIKADTQIIEDSTLKADPTAGSLSRFVASGGTALGTQLPASKSLYDVVVVDRLSGAETISSYDLPNDLVENTAIELTVSTRQRLDSVWLDFVNLLQNVTIKVYHKIDASTYRQYDTYYWTTNDEDGVLITDVTINNDWKLTITSDVVQGGIKAIPYNIIKTVME